MIKYYATKRSNNLKTGPLHSFVSDKTMKKVMINSYSDSSDSSLSNSGKRLTRDFVLKVLNAVDRQEISKISRNEYYANTTYYRIVEYLATLLCYYWVAVPQVYYSEKNINDIKQEWWNVLHYIELINPEKLAPQICRKVLLEGCCYLAVKEKGYTSDRYFGIQYLPLKYCRSTSTYRGREVVDFDILYFDKEFSDLEKRNIALQTFPEFISKKYFEYKSQKVHKKDDNWIALDPDLAFKFSIRPDDMPVFFGVILDLLDLQDVKDISMFKMEQEMSKIFVQKFGLDKDGVPIVQGDDLRSYHQDVSEMIANVPGVDVITTFADVDSIDISPKDRESSSTSSPTQRALSNVYDLAGISSNLFNSANAGTLAKSVIVDESLLFTTILAQFNEFLNVRVKATFKKAEVKDLNFYVYMPQISFQNREQMSKSFKEQTSLGFSKFLPAIALGERQTFIMASLFFENEVLGLVDLMKPPVSSNTMSSSTQTKEINEEEKKVGRPEKSDEERSEKTMRNRESL